MRIGFRIAVAAAALAAGACTAVAAPAAPARLVQDTTCDQLEQRMERRALPLVTPYGLSGGELSGVVPAAPRVVPAPGTDVAVGAPEAATAPAAAAPDFTGTNVQEAGVDEPDLVKTDGRTLFAIAGGRVRALSVAGGGLVPLDALSLDGVSPEELLLAGDRLLVMGTRTGGGAVPVSPVAEVAVGVPGTTETVLVQVDVSDPARMRVLGRMTVEGGRIAARLTGTTARVVVSTPVSDLPLVSPDGPGAAEARAARRTNRARVANARTRAWLPTYRTVRPGRKVSRGLAVRCRDVSHPTRFAGLGTVTVLTVDVAAPLAIEDSDAVVTDGGVVYASPESLYVTTPRWIDPSAADSPDAFRGAATGVHRFDTRTPGVTEYRASGVVPGFVLNQFSLSEKDGRLRVASTEEPSWWSGADEESQSRVTVLEDRDGRLAPIGRVTGIGRGERIYAVRFIDDLAYVVTFRQVDPLHVVDLSEPTAPRLRGELVIPGYSSYLHPLSGARLLGIGQGADAQGVREGTQVSLFSVADPDAPVRLARHDLPGAWSEAETDHHAVLVQESSGLVVIPVADGAADSGALAMRLVGDAVVPLARIVHPGAAGPAVIRRSLVVDGVLYTVSDEAVRADDATTLAERAFVRFSP